MIPVDGDGGKVSYYYKLMHGIENVLFQLWENDRFFFFFLWPIFDYIRDPN